MVSEVYMIFAKAALSSHLVLGEKRPNLLVDFLTYLNDNLFSGAKVSDN